VLEPITSGGGARPAVVADAGYGDNTTFRMELTARGWQYVVAVKGTTSARPHDTVPEMMPYGGRGRPGLPRYRARPVSLRRLALASADQVRPVTWRQGTRATRGNPDASMTSCFLAIRARPANRDIPAAPTAPCRTAGCSPNGPRSRRAHGLLAV
jgi:SRSO17 transposase